MKQVNIHFVTALLEPLVGGADDDDVVERYRHVDPDCEAQIRDVVRSRLLPHLKRFDTSSREMAERSLRYFLSKQGTDFQRLYESCLLPIATPSSPQQFFIWMCEELFGRVSFRLEDLSRFQENNDIHGPNSIRLAPANEP